MNSCDPLVESLLEEEVVKKHGPQVICYDLVTLSLKQGRAGETIINIM